MDKTHNAIIRPGHFGGAELTFAPLSGARTETRSVGSFREAVALARANPAVAQIFARPKYTSGRFGWHKIAR